MKQTSYRLLQLLLLLICASHVALGLGINLVHSFPEMAATWYGAKEIDWTPQFTYILRPVGAYMVVMGMLTAVALMNPRKHTIIVFALATLLLIRAAQRLVFQEEIAAAFDIGTARNVTNAIFFGALGAGLFVLRILAGGKPSS